MSDIKLKASKRTVFGKRTRYLRRQGVTPTHVFGNGIKSLALQCDNDELKKLITRVGVTRLIDLQIEKERKPRHVFIREIQRDVLSGELLHVDFYQVDKTEKMTAEIPIILSGESPALKTKTNIIEQLINSIQVEAFPAEMPPHIEIDISNLAQDGDSVYVKDIVFEDDVATTADPEQLIAKITKIKAIAEEEVEVTAAEDAETVSTPDSEATDETEPAAE
ncbi:MAG: 50S ribosomal protein L25 [Dehalococcoidales bacterium]